jgi:hypothetical protein
LQEPAGSTVRWAQGKGKPEAKTSEAISLQGDLALPPVSQAPQVCVIITHPYVCCSDKPVIPNCDWPNRDTSNTNDTSST